MANTVTCIRILCAIALLFCDAFSQWFCPIYILGGISDVLDGFIARRLKTESKLGARLDTIADFAFTAVVLIKVFSAVSVPKWLVFWIICIAVIKCINVITGFAVSGHFVSEHTAMNKATGVLLFVVPLCVFRFHWQPDEVLMIPVCAFATAAAIQEWHDIRTGKEFR